MSKEILSINLTEKEKNVTYPLYYSKFMHKSLCIIIIFSFCFFGELYFEQNLAAKSQGRNIQLYVKDSAVLQASKSEARIAEQRNKGRKVKYYVLKKSVLQGRKSMGKNSAKKIIETGFVSSKMIKNNHWFVKKPTQLRNSKVNIAREYNSSEVNPTVSKKISRNALQISKTRARITGAAKPDTLFPEESSRNAFQISKTRARATGAAKPDTLFPEESSRGALKMTKTRASVTGPVKPDIVYSKKISRKVREMSLKRTRKNITAQKNLSVGKGNVYTAKELINMGKNSKFAYETSSSEKDTVKKKSYIEKN